jgi:hypothetical protein
VSASDFALNWEKNAIETFKMLKIYFIDQTMVRTEVFEWFLCLKAV